MRLEGWFVSTNAPDVINSKEVNTHYGDKKKQPLKHDKRASRPPPPNVILKDYWKGQLNSFNAHENTCGGEIFSVRNVGRVLSVLQQYGTISCQSILK